MPAAFKQVKAEIRHVGQRQQHAEQVWHRVSNRFSEFKRWRAGKQPVLTHSLPRYMPEKTSCFNARDIQLLEVKLYTKPIITEV